MYTIYNKSHCFFLQTTCYNSTYYTYVHYSQQITLFSQTPYALISGSMSTVTETLFERNKWNTFYVMNKSEPAHKQVS